MTAWNKFWFSPLPKAPLYLMRWLLGLTLFVLYVQRQWAVEKFFGIDAIIPQNVALEIMPEFHRPPFLLFGFFEPYVSSLHLLFLLGLLVFTFGFAGRWFALIVWLLHISFIQRNYAVAFGADLIGGIFLFYLAWANSSSGLTLKNIFQKGFKRSWQEAWSEETDLLGSVFYRLLQVQLCVIYAYTGFEKLKGASWWDGTALWTILANPQMTLLDMTWLRWAAPLIVIGTFSTILFEIYFPVLVWFKHWRKPMLVIGFLFHLGIGLSMGLFAFAAVMISSYCLFLRKEDLQRISR